MDRLFADLIHFVNFQWRYRGLIMIIFGGAVFCRRNEGVELRNKPRIMIIPGGTAPVGKWKG